MKKRILAILLASALTATPVSYVFAEEGTTQSIQTQEIQAQEVQAQTQEVPVEQGGVTGGYLDNDLEWNPPVYSDDSIRSAAELPSAYPGSIDAIQAKYPEPGNQNPYGTCWAFSTMGMAEFDLINKGMATQGINLSELQLDIFYL